MSKKILYFSFEPLKQGHASYTHVTEIIHGLEKRDWDVDLLAPAYDKTILPGIFSRILTIARITTAIIFRKKSDLLYSRMHFGSYLIVIYCHLRKIPVVTEVNGPFEDLYIAWPLAKYFRIVFDHFMMTQLSVSKLIISVTPGLDNYVKEKLGHIKPNNRKYSVIPNGANTELFKPLTDNHQKITHRYDLPGKKYAIFFGTFAPWQGINLLIDTATSEQWPNDLDLVIVGDGAFRNTIENISDIYQHIHYLGVVNYKDMPSIIASAIMSFVLSDITGGRHITGLYPLKLFESMACGVPIIATNQPGQADVIKESQSGVLLEITDSISLLNTIKELLKNPDRMIEMGQNGRQYVEKYHSWDVLSDKTHNVLSQII